MSKNHNLSKLSVKKNYFLQLKNYKKNLAIMHTRNIKPNIFPKTSALIMMNELI